jgi:hypothetical protein
MVPFFILLPTFIMRKKWLLLIGMMLFSISQTVAQYDTEMQQAYQYAYSQKITTMDTIETANL